MEAFKALNRLGWISFECFEGDLTNVRGCKLKQSTRKLSHIDCFGGVWYPSRNALNQSIGPRRVECNANGKWRLTVDAFPPKLIGINDERRKWFIGSV
ncbi:MAG: hypothetical protein ACTS4T_00840 [Candidatus Hodgkinia cicadicola]